MGSSRPPVKCPLPSISTQFSSGGPVETMTLSRSWAQLPANRMQGRLLAVQHGTRRVGSIFVSRHQPQRPPRSVQLLRTDCPWDFPVLAHRLQRLGRPPSWGFARPSTSSVLEPLQAGCTQSLSSFLDSTHGTLHTQALRATASTARYTPRGRSLSRRHSPGGAGVWSYRFPHSCSQTLSVPKAWLKLISTRQTRTSELHPFPGQPTWDAAR